MVSHLRTQLYKSQNYYHRLRARFNSISDIGHRQTSDSAGTVISTMAVPLALAATGAVNYLGEFQTLAKSGMMFNGDIGAQVMSNMWEMCKSAPTKSNTPFSHVFIHDKIAKEFDGDNLSDWVQKLDNHMVTACTMAVRDLKLWLKEHGADYLTWDKVESILSLIHI